MQGFSLGPRAVRGSCASEKKHQKMTGYFGRSFVWFVANNFCNVSEELLSLRMSTFSYLYVCVLKDTCCNSMKTRKILKYTKSTQSFAHIKGCVYKLEICKLNLWLNATMFVYPQISDVKFISIFVYLLTRTTVILVANSFQQICLRVLFTLSVDPHFRIASSKPGKWLINSYK